MRPRISSHRSATARRRARGRAPARRVRLAAGADRVDLGSRAGAVPSSFAPTTVTLVTHDSFALTEDAAHGLHRAHRHHREDRDRGRRRRGGQQGGAHRGQPRGRRAVRRRQHAALARARRPACSTRTCSPAAAAVPSALKAATDDAVTPVDYGDVCVNVDDAWFAAQGRRRRRPRSTTSRSPRTGTCSSWRTPATSSPGPRVPARDDRALRRGRLPGLLAARCARNGVKVVNGWTEAYEGEFSARRQGRPGRSSCRTPRARRPRSSTPPTPSPREPATSVHDRRLLPPGRVRRRPARHEEPEAARAVVDWLLSPEVQADVPLSMFVFPAADRRRRCPKVFDRLRRDAERAADARPGADRRRTRADWVDTWDQVTLR